jgi:ankyrin repeat protein
LTPVHTAALKGHAEVVTILLKAGAEVNAKVLENCTPLYYAAENGHAEVVKILLMAGADPRAADRAGKTPHAITQSPECRDLLWSAMMEKPLK